MDKLVEEILERVEGLSVSGAHYRATQFRKNPVNREALSTPKEALFKPKDCRKIHKKLTEKTKVILAKVKILKEKRINNF